jgi:ribonuclease G
MTYEDSEVEALSKKLFINSLARETRVAYLEDQKLVEYMIERPIEKRIVGNIYKGKVANVLPGMQAAFVDIGIGKNAFLYVDDIYPSKGYKRDDNENLPPIRDLIREGEEVLVQVNKEAVGTKGARITANISLPGRYLVYLPFGGHVGISRRIENEAERERLKDLGEGLVEENEGLIIRTICEGVEEYELKQDVAYLRNQWREILDHSITISTASIVFQEVDIISKLVRDLMTPEINECTIDDQTQYLRLKNELQEFPELNKRLVLYSGNQNIFDYYQITAELDRALRNRVWLKSGGYIIIDHTEALTVIDVNTGKFTGTQNLEETVLRTNLEAAKEIARQLRLRDIGGIIVIDFIDMIQPENQQAVLQQLEESLKQDRTKTNIAGLTSLGLVEMTRKKVRQSVLEVLSKDCTYCEGKGYTLSEETVAAQVERILLEYRKQDIGAILVQVHPVVAGKFLGSNRQLLQSIEQKCGFKIFIYSNEKAHIEESRILYSGTLSDVKRQLERLQND